MTYLYVWFLCVPLVQEVPQVVYRVEGLSSKVRPVPDHPEGTDLPKGLHGHEAHRARRVVHPAS